MAKQELGPWQEAWLQALESGDYWQGKEFLCRRRADGDYEMCCLGVACELVLANGVSLTVSDEPGRAVVYDKHDVSVPSIVGQTLRLRGRYGESSGPNVKVRREWCCGLAEMNDVGATFKRIAKTVRRHPEHYFTEPA